MIDMIRKILHLFTPPERRRLGILLVLLFLASVLEVLGISSIFPFMEVITDPDVGEADSVAGRLYRRFDLSEVEQLPFLLGIGLLVFVTASNAFLVLTKTLVARFTWGRNFTIGRELIKRYMNAPYPFFLGRNSADLSKNILMEIGIFINGVLVPLMDVVAKGLTSLLILVLLIIVDPVAALTVAAALGTFYLLVLLVVQKRLRIMGQERIEANSRLFEAVSQAFGGIKEIKLLGREEVFVRNFARPSYEYADLNTRMTVMRIIPRHLLEVIAYLAIVVVVLYSLAGNEDPAEALPLLSLYALAGFRLMPYFQAIYDSVARIRFSVSALDQIYSDFVERRPIGSSQEDEPVQAQQFSRDVELRDVVYSYPEAPSRVLNGLTLEIEKGAMIGLVGVSGSGKTTTVDLILGLLRPDEGALVVDGATIDDQSVRGWQRRLGYVPQHIYLVDGTILENIALGVDPEEVDPDRVQASARLAMVHDFVNGLPEGYRTVVGEEGVRLSGGQRQRIGIARSLYHRPDLLILDEATNAVDAITEGAIIHAIRTQEDRPTMVVISHRLSALRDCDEIYILEGGDVVDRGRYKELIERSELFGDLARVGAGA